MKTLISQLNSHNKSQHQKKTGYNTTQFIIITASKALLYKINYFFLEFSLEKQNLFKQKKTKTFCIYIQRKSKGKLILPQFSIINYDVP